MVVKLKTLGGALFFAALMTPVAQAQDCRLSLNQSTLDYGVIRHEAVLGTRLLHLSVLCTQPSAIALRFSGAGDAEGFRFGQQGRFRLTLKHAQVDGRAIDWSGAHLPGDSSVAPLPPGQVLVARAVGKRLIAQVEIEVDLPADALQVRNHVVLEGRGSFELVSPTVPLSR
ncbi:MULTISPECIES: hypothetical protein [Pseudomonas]|jgi:hypothetical protein|uniref:DUF1120 domain-containing protein n=1 Tax=Pseudomonas quebecensis TaxID=2995174 RepID=A0ABY6QFG1_9PSED|nr:MULTISPECIES: hypothetical protein [Pseudomonas]MCX4065447.1 hypothetical protein [Pseudomonas quebecensis]UZW18734.1 hypothetical protein OSC50_25740 [Pseudomonas quebecensis]UZW23852.1 hypothetical protein OSC48_25750 [Pseudomonas quebecensis]UZW28914.1 hypothetical protein OSC49_25755 [Pseudomonas quebecensis]